MSHHGCGVYSRAAFILNIFALKCDVDSRAASKSNDYGIVGLQGLAFFEMVVQPMYCSTRCYKNCRVYI